MIKRVSFAFFSKVSVAAMNLVLTVLLSRYLGPSGKGLAALLVTNIALMLLFFNLMGGATLVFLAPRYPIKKLLLLGYAWTILLAPLLCLIASAFNIIPSNYLFQIGILAILDSFLGIQNNLLMGKEKVKLVNTITFLRALTNVICLVGFFQFTVQPSIHHFLTALLIGYSITVTVGIIALLPILRQHLPIEIPEFNWYIMGKKALDLGFTNQIAHVVQFANLRLSYFLLSHYAANGTSGLGVYSNGVALSESVWMISNSMAMIQFAKIANSNDRRASIELTNSMIRITFVLSAIALLTILLVPSEVYVTLFGKGFEGIRSVLITLSPGILFYSIVLLLDHYFSGIGKYRINIWANLAGLLTTLAFSILLTNYFKNYNQIYAGVIASFSYACNFFVLVYFFRQESKTILHERPL